MIAKLKSGTFLSMVISLFAGLVVLISIALNFGFALLLYSFLILGLAMLIVSDNLTLGKEILASLTIAFIAVTTPLVIFLALTHDLLAVGMTPTEIAKGTRFEMEFSAFTPFILRVLTVVYLATGFVSAGVLFIATKIVSATRANVGLVKFLGIADVNPSRYRIGLALFILFILGVVATILALL